MEVQVLCGLTLLACLVYTTTGIPADSTLYFNSVHQPKPKADQDEKTYLFAVDGLKKPYSFLDDYGTLVGFDVDIVNAVCRIAGKKCSLVLQEFTECAFTHRDMNYPGHGLMGGWFDACPSYAITEDRLSTLDFTDAYLQTSATFAVTKGNPHNFDPSLSDYSNFTLCHLTGAPTNVACLNRLKKKFGKIVIAKDLPEAKELLSNNTVQAVFSPRQHIDGIDILGVHVHCDEGGAGVMVKKGSTLPLWWNPAFRSLYNSPEYQSLCDRVFFKYGRSVPCLPPPSPGHQ